MTAKHVTRSVIENALACPSTSSDSYKRQFGTSISLYFVMNKRNHPKEFCFLGLFFCPLLFCPHINHFSNLYCLTDHLSGEISTSHPGSIRVVLAFHLSSLCAIKI